MDFSQDKLTKKEWDATEVPVSDDEMRILKLITDGYHNVNIKRNDYSSIFTHLKIEYSESLENYIYDKFLKAQIATIAKNYNAPFIIIAINAKSIVIKTADKIRMEKTSLAKLEEANVFECALIYHVDQLLKHKHTHNTIAKHYAMYHPDSIAKPNITVNNRWVFHYITLFKLMKTSISRINSHVRTIVSRIIEHYEDEIDLKHIISNSREYIERNQYLLKYADMELYEHQKQIITISKDPRPKLVLYIAPTGTGKTLTPLALSEHSRIIFVCAARHVGLALARAAISVNKRIAFAFGCNSADNVRLHYFSAKKFTKNTRTGGIFKVDNAVGVKVEIMICDIRSYIPAMLYMMAFNEPANIITYWDEPTITMDYADHEFHAIIKRNWDENLIPNMVLSSATLPKLHELTDTVADFSDKFAGAVIHNIVSHDCRKSIPIINKNGYVEMPHYMTADYGEMQQIVAHCENYLTLLRYYDLAEASKFIEYVDSLIPANLRINRHITSIDDITMQSIKLQYLRAIKGLDEVNWNATYLHFMSMRVRRIGENERIDASGSVILKSASVDSVAMTKSGQPLARSASVCTTSSSSNIPTKSTENGNAAIYITTKDAYTLTDGPTIFIVENVEKIARFSIQQANIPACVMGDIMEKIEFNNKVNSQMDEMEKQMADLLATQSDKISKTRADTSGSKQSKSTDANKRDEKDEPENKVSEMRLLSENMLQLQSLIKLVSLNETFVPNKLMHIAKWANTHIVPNAFTSDVEEEVVVQIMALYGVDDSWKILLLLGIGVMATHRNPAYTEIMKTMADKQQLYMIIATSDYIYGTNYQFCHGYISKDLDLTQEKIIQAMGRIGRNNIQQEYSIRFRDDEKIRKLFTCELVKPEVINMGRLFNSKNN